MSPHAPRFAKKKGTEHEVAFVDWLGGQVGAEVMRRTQHGTADKGDAIVVGAPLMIDVKSGKTPLLARWAEECDRQTRNAGVRYGVMVWSPPGVGIKSVDRWIALEWMRTAMRPFDVHGATFYSGTLAGFARAVALVAPAPLYRLQDARDAKIVSGHTLFTDDRWVRARLVSEWVGDVSELLARTALAR
jgi:hypothetical protein